MQKIIDKLELLSAFCCGARAIYPCDNPHIELFLDEVTEDLKSISQELQEMENNRIKEVWTNPSKAAPLVETKDINLGTKVRDVLTIRTSNALFGEKIYTLNDLIKQSASSLLKMPNLGKKSLKEIEEYLASNNLSLKCNAQ